MKIAITRQLSPAINECELTHLSRAPINFKRACAQHQQYENALRSLGVDVISLAAEPHLPDSVFVEDMALVLDECAILTNPGAVSRRAEVSTVEATLAPYRKIFRILPPDTLDGGDILTVGRTIYIGLTQRSTNDAIEQMRNIVKPFAYEVRAVPVTGCLHLKTAVTQVGKNTLLINPAWVSQHDFPGQNFIEVDSSEPSAANAVLIGNSIIYPSAFPQTKARLEKAGINILTVDADELAKAEGAVTCCSLLFDAPG